ncbi:unnamed protein product, partial [Trichogramma brassicae]
HSLVFAVNAYPKSTAKYRNREQEKTMKNGSADRHDYRWSADIGSSVRRHHYHTRWDSPFRQQMSGMRYQHSLRSAGSLPLYKRLLRDHMRRSSSA